MKLQKSIQRIPQARSRARRGVAIATCAISATLLLLVVLVYWSDISPLAASSTELRQQHPMFPPGVELEAPNRQVIGNLGGLPVTFPPGFVRNVEYEGDPGFGEQRKGAVPQRTHSSGIRGLSFTARYPDFAVTTRKEREQDRRLYNIYDTPWISVSITSGGDFGDGQFLEHRWSNRNNDPEFQYKKLPEKKFGLEVYTPINVDETLRSLNPITRVYRSDSRDKDLFFNFSEDGKINSYIECSNRNHGAATCLHFFNFTPLYRIQAAALYRREQLEHWQQIQASIQRLILSFKSN